jgi:diaminopimelate decarboxylase
MFRTYGRDPHLRLTGIHLHLGSPIYSAQPYVEAIGMVLPLIERLRESGFAIEVLNIGGGFAADYESGQSPSYQQYADEIVPLLRQKQLRVILEPGRTIIANAGVLLNRVLYIKQGGQKRFAVLESGFNHLLRPAMYEAFHFVWPVRVSPSYVPAERRASLRIPGLETYDVVGPLCETGDVLAAGRRLPPLQRGDLLCIFTAGAYGMVMASNYNAMPRPAEVLVDGQQVRLIRRRETYEDLVAAELDL